MAQPGRYESPTLLCWHLPKTAPSHTAVLLTRRGDPESNRAAVMLVKQSSIPQTQAPEVE